MKELQDRINRHLSKLISAYKVKMEIIAVSRTKDFYMLVTTKYLSKMLDNESKMRDNV